MAARMRWSFGECNQVAERALHLRREEPELSKHDSLFRGQDVLPPERKKSRMGAVLMRSMYARMDKIEQRARSQQPLAPIIKPDPIAPPPPAPPTIPELLMQLGTALANALQPVIEKAIANAAAKIVTVTPIPAPVPMEHAINAPAGNGNGKNGESHLPEKFRTHKVAIIGMSDGGQQQMMKQRFPHLDFRFVTNDQKHGQIENVTKHCEASFVMTRWVAHKTERGVTGEKHKVNGGLSDLTRLLTARFPQSHSIDVTH